jgi:hypothetical protein
LAHRCLLLARYSLAAVALKQAALERYLPEPGARRSCHKKPRPLAMAVCN